jgi:hypothetical protein
MKFCTICEKIQTECDGHWEEGRPDIDETDQYEYGIHHKNCMDHYIHDLLRPNVPEPECSRVELQVRERYNG